MRITKEDVDMFVAAGDDLPINRLLQVFREVVNALDDAPTISDDEALRLQYQAVYTIAAELSVAPALVGEPMFILMGRDPASPGALRRWVELAVDLDYSDQRVSDAQACHESMIKWRRAKNAKLT